jgi:hypothetical protein
MPLPDRVTKGQRLAAATVNSLIDGLDALQRRIPGRTGLPSGITGDPGLLVAIQNCTGAALETRHIVNLHGLAIENTPGADPLILRAEIPSDQSDASTATGSGDAPQVGRWAIVRDPIEPDAVGRAWVSGVVMCRCKLNDIDHNFVDSISGDVSSLQTCQNGPGSLLWINPDAQPGDTDWAVVRFPIVPDAVPRLYKVTAVSGNTLTACHLKSDNTVSMVCYDFTKLET